MDPFDITAVLKIPPDTQHRLGEPRVRRSLRTGKVLEYAPHSCGMWSFSSKRWVQSPRLEMHLVWFLDQLEPLEETLLALQQRCKMNFFCFATGQSTRPPTIPKSVRSRAELIGVPIEIDYYPLKTPRRSTE